MSYRAILIILIFLADQDFLAQENNCSLPGDLTGDSLVTINDLTTLLSHYGNDYTLTDQDSACSPVTYHGYTYEVVLIGEQCWFAENLRTYQYANGDSLVTAQVITQHVIDGWAASDSVGVCVIPEMLYNAYYPSIPDWYWNNFGLLYSRLAIIDERSICPIGWSIPSGFDFDYINDYYPPEHFIEVGSHLDTSGTWGSDNSECASNLYGLTVRGSGEISYGTIYSVTSRANFWCFEYQNTIHRTYNSCGGPGEIWGGVFDNARGGAIRCLKD